MLALLSLLSLSLAQEAEPLDARQFVEIAPRVGFGVSSIDGAMWQLGAGLAYEARLGPRFGLTATGYGNVVRSSRPEVWTAGGRVGVRHSQYPASASWFFDLETGFERKWSAMGARPSSISAGHVGYRFALDSGLTATVRLGPGLRVPLDGGQRATVLDGGVAVGWRF